MVMAPEVGNGGAVPAHGLCAVGCMQPCLRPACTACTAHRMHGPTDMRLPSSWLALCMLRCRGRSVALQVACGLLALHSRGVVHMVRPPCRLSL